MYDDIFDFFRTITYKDIINQFIRLFWCISFWFSVCSASFDSIPMSLTIVSMIRICGSVDLCMLSICGKYSVPTMYYIILSTYALFAARYLISDLLVHMITRLGEKHEDMMIAQIMHHMHLHTDRCCTENNR